MKFVAALSLVLALLVAVNGLVQDRFYSEQEVDSMFEQFKNDFSKEYATSEEHVRRRSVFHENIEFIVRHNQVKRSYRVGVNQFADLTNEEFRLTMLTQLRLPSKLSPMMHLNSSVKDLPDSVDWVAKGAVTTPINQGQCGSSWAIPAVAAIEGQHAIRGGKALLALSIQQLIDCCDQDGNQGCNGGFINDAYNCVSRMGGIDTAASYPYNGDADEKCLFNPKTIGERVNGYVEIAKTEDAVQNAVATAGPLAAAVDASQSSFQFYSWGVYDEPACSPVNVDHGVTIVGYGSLDDDDYWKVKNSWGTSWGMNGYILMSRNKQNQCGIATMTSYPVVY